MTHFNNKLEKLLSSDHVARNVLTTTFQWANIRGKRTSGIHWFGCEHNTEIYLETHSCVDVMKGRNQIAQEITETTISVHTESYDSK